MPSGRSRGMGPPHTQGSQRKTPHIRWAWRRRPPSSQKRACYPRGPGPRSTSVQMLKGSPPTCPRRCRRPFAPEHVPVRSFGRCGRHPSGPPLPAPRPPSRLDARPLAAPISRAAGTSPSPLAPILFLQSKARPGLSLARRPPACFAGRVPMEGVPDWARGGGALWLARGLFR